MLSVCGWQVCRRHRGVQLRTVPANQVLSRRHSHAYLVSGGVLLPSRRQRPHPVPARLLVCREHAVSLPRQQPEPSRRLQSIPVPVHGRFPGRRLHHRHQPLHALQHRVVLPGRQWQYLHPVPGQLLERRRVGGAGDVPVLAWLRGAQRRALHAVPERLSLPQRQPHHLRCQLPSARGLFRQLLVYPGLLQRAGWRPVPAVPRQQ